MKRLLITLGCVGLMLSAARAEDVPPKAQPLELKTTRDQASYAIGQDIGLRLKNLDVNSAALIQGLMDALKGSPAKLTPQQIQAAMTAFNRELETKMAEKARIEGDRNRKEGAAFLAANKSKPGVVTLPSGLQYIVLKAGNGPTPTIADKVKTHYHGTFINGKVFDSTVGGEPSSFAVGGGLIRGWVEALQKMKVGDKWKLFVPAEQAYGSDGFGPDIGPNAVLIFELELLGIEKQ
jgi:FKBP-type peptidyl-prolyl cis-trans isomerase FklB